MYFQDKLYTDLTECNNNTKYSAGEVCTINTYCSNSGYYILLEVGCLTSPAWTAPLLEPIYKKIKARSISVLGGGGSGIETDRLYY
jgi:hypothetical protein